MKHSLRTKILLVAGFLALAAALVWAKNQYKTGTNTKPPARNTAPLSDEDLKAVIAGMRLDPGHDKDDQRLVKLGRALFFDAGFSCSI
jgi:cytochrome c peroxidase